jgi:hypothetical protein
VNTFGFDCLRRAIPPRQIHEKVKSTEERAEVVCTVELDVGRISVTVSWSYIVDRRSYTCTDRPHGCTWSAKRRKERSDHAAFEIDMGRGPETTQTDPWGQVRIDLR